MYSRDEVIRLAEFESYFHSAVYSDYVRNMPSTKLDVIKKAFERATGETIKDKLSCGICQLNFFRRAGKLYYESRDYYAKVDKEEQDAKDEAYKKELLKKRMARARAARKNKKEAEAMNEQHTLTQS